MRKNDFRKWQTIRKAWEVFREAFGKSKFGKIIIKRERKGIGKIVREIIVIVVITIIVTWEILREKFLKAIEEIDSFGRDFNWRKQNIWRGPSLISLILHSWL